MEYDFKNWVSFPSSIKIITDKPEGLTTKRLPWVPVTPRSQIRVSCKVKTEGVTVYPSRIGVWVGYDSEEKEIRALYIRPMGAFDWHEDSQQFVLPDNALRMMLYLGGAFGTTWFDDLKIYQDDVLIYENNFTAPIAKGAVMTALPIVTGLGVVRFGKKG